VSNAFIQGYDIARAGFPLGSLLPPGSVIALFYADAEQRVLTLRDFLVALQDFEQRMNNAARAAQLMASKGLLTRDDARVYDALADALFLLERWLYDVIRRLVPRVVADQIPQPIRLPYAHALAGRPSREALPQGLGAAPVVAAGVIWAGIVLALLAAVAAGSLVYAFTSGDVAAEEAKQAIAVGEIKERQFSLLLERRKAVYDECVARGGTSEECAEAARTLNPTPEEAGLVPETLSGRTTWVGPVLAIAGVVAVGGLLYVLLANRRKSRGTVDDDDYSFMGLGRMARSVKRLDGPSRYYLEIPADARRHR
jgi:hypothetical protein